METRPIKAGEDDQCGIERVDDHRQPPRTYMCGLNSRIVWLATPNIAIPICRDCKRWLETLLSLGLPLI